MYDNANDNDDDGFFSRWFEMKMNYVFLNRNDLRCKNAIRNVSTLMRRILQKKSWELKCLLVR